MLLGDDIVIADDAVAKAYKELLSEWDINYSVMKTHDSKYGYEFAKQIILHNINISPFPLAALFERRNSPIESVGIIIQEIWRKDWEPDLGIVLKDYFIKILLWPRPRFRSFSPKLDLTVSLLAYLQGRKDLGPAVMQYVALWTKQEWQFNRVLSEAFAHWISMKTVHILFEESRDRVTNYDRNRLPLGELATRMVMEITGLRDGGADCFDLIESVPFLQVYGRAEETYLQMLKPLNDTGIGSRGKALKSAIGKVDIPLSDRDFYVRHRDVLIIQALKASNHMVELIKTTPQVVSWNGRVDFTVPWYTHTKYSGSLLPDPRLGRSTPKFEIEYL
jgi:hypothetical protein